jgi:hypothetical protein
MFLYDISVSKTKNTFIFLCNAVKFFMYNHVEMIVVLYHNFCIRNMLPKSVYVCALEASSRMYERREGKGENNHTSIHA